MRQPEHACALLTDRHGRLVLQLRPARLRHAASQLTCFGGKRDGDETAADCLRRELMEETGWSPDGLPGTGLVDLRAGERWIARFFPLALPHGVELRTEPGFIAIHADVRTLPGLPLSPWHAAAIAAWREGRAIAEVED